MSGTSDDYSPTNGKGKIGRDSKLGAIAAGAITAALLYVADALRSVDLTALPDILEPAGAGLIATATAWLVTKASKR